MDILQFQELLRKKKAIPQCILFCPRVTDRKKSYEPFLVEETVSELIKINFSPGTEEFGVKTFYGDEATIEDVIVECKTHPFFTPQKMVIVRKFENYDKDGRKKDKELNLLLEYIENPSEFTILICITESIDPEKILYKTFEKMKGVVESPALSPAKIKEWIRDTLLSHNKRILSEALEELIARTGPSLTEINNALTLLLNYVGKRQVIKIEDVIYSCADVAEESIWNLTDAIANADSGKACEVLNDLLNQGKTVSEIIGVIHWLLENAYKTTSASEEKPKSSFVANKVAPLAQRFGIKKLITAMNLCNEVTAQMRQSGVDERLAIELLVIKLAYSPTAKHQ
ncbi:MAG: DNA polymerase III subunit delta [Candidatus Hydrogenedentes bacterium]|nr:DNA polymerase III subunit delta [Candidatus Hydrogenedentota bacterium]